MVPLVGQRKEPVGAQLGRGAVPRFWTSLTGSLVTVWETMLRSISSLLT